MKRKVISLICTFCLLISAITASVFSVEASGLGTSPTGTLSIEGLRTQSQTRPIGIDILSPKLSWLITCDGFNQKQTAYRVIAAGKLSDLESGTGVLWDSGKVESALPYSVFGDRSKLSSRQKVFWKVMVWDANGEPSEWSDPAFFEMGLLKASDWEADWIGRGAGSNIITNGFQPVTARYVRMKVLSLGPNPMAEGWNRLQFMEWEIYNSENPSINIARGKKVTATAEMAQEGAWASQNLTDGAYTNAYHGYSTQPLSGRDISASPVYITIDLGEEMTFDSFRLYGRTDAVSNQENICPNYPENYDIECSNNGTDFTRHTNIAVTIPPRIVTELPIFAKDFNVDTSKVVSARLYISGLGLYEAHINGENVADTLFDPGETDFEESVQYVTYDVTKSLKSGANAIGIMLGNGVYNIGSTPGRYQKYGMDRAAELKCIAQLEITKTDGSIEKIITDNQFYQTEGPITFSGWYGGEDYDARKEIAGWDKSGTDQSNWGNAGLVSPPKGALTARNTTPIRKTDEIIPKAVTKLSNGHYLVDMGVNFAGIYELTLPGMTAALAGTTVKLHPAELLNAGGTVNQESTGSPIYDSYTIRGAGEEKFSPRFVYHGYRYLEIEGMPFEPSVENITGYAVRTDNERTGNFTSSSDLLNGIEKIVDRSIESNMYSTLTDCPAREKLGWLEVSQLLYESMAYSYDIHSWMTKLSRDMAESQTETGQVPGVAPEYIVFEDSLRSDPSWGGASVLVPWYTWQVYADDSLLHSMYPTMQKYIEYLKTRSVGDLLNIGLGDWGAYDATTPRELVVSAAYYNLVDVMSEISALLGEEDDSAEYIELKGKIKTAFNAKYFNAEKNSYGTGSQASNACALFAGLVPEGKADAVVDKLVESIESKDWHLSTGEVGLKQMLSVLGKYGRSDAVYKMVTRTDMPSYGYFIENGATSLPEFWDMGASQNHCMMGHIKEWFYKYLSGIGSDLPGFKKMTIKPFIPDDLESAGAEITTSYGHAESSWVKGEDNTIALTVEIPVGASADIYVPAMGSELKKVLVNGKAVTGEIDGDYIVFRDVLSGKYKFERVQILEQTLDNAKQAAESALSGLKAANDTTAADLMELIQAEITNEDITASWSTPFTISAATVTDTGHIKGAVTLTLNSESVMIEINLTIPRLPAVLDKSALEEAVKQAEKLNESEYTKESYASFKAVLTRAQELLADAELTAENQASINATVKDLKEAADNLIKKPDVSSGESSSNGNNIQAENSGDSYSSGEDTQNSSDGQGEPGSSNGHIESSNADSSSPKTGDNSSTVIFIIILISVAVAVITISKAKGRGHKT